MADVCSKCKEAPPRHRQRYCRLCHNAAQRVYNERRGGYAALSPTEKWKARARSYLKVYVRRGKIIKPPACEECGFHGPLHGHHHDYDKPLDVRWLCEVCHRDAHGV